MSEDKKALAEDPIITVRKLRKYYRVGQTRVAALNGVDFDVAPGEFCSIVGTSGSGKSTLLNMLAGLEPPTGGDVIIDGRNIGKLNERGLVRWRRENVGFIFQSFNLIQTLTAIENVALPLVFRGEDKARRERKARHLLKIFGLAKHMNHKPSEMSGGQQQRVGIARAMVVSPSIIYADEPTGNLDSKTAKDIMELIQSITKKNKQSLIMVTHDNNLANYADRVIRIIDGKIISIESGSNRYEIRMEMEQQRHEEEPASDASKTPSETNGEGRVQDDETTS